MKTPFSCPHCQTKQKLRRIWLLSGFSVWNCHHCNGLIKPGKLSPMAFVVGFLSSSVPASIALYRWHWPLAESLLFGAVIGGIVYLLSGVYFYLTIKLERAD